MTKRIFSYCLLCFLAANVCSQTTYYYKLTNIYNNIISLKIQGGQFITFIGDICYESDKTGIGVGHGIMTYNSDYSTSNIKRYMGKSYWGDDAVYAFNANKSVLNVVLENDMVLVYKRSTPPDGIYTSSLIRLTNSSNSSGSVDNSANSYNPMLFQSSSLPVSESNPNTTTEPHLTAAQYQQNYNGYEKIAEGIIRSFQINPDMNYGPRVQNMQTLHDAQNNMRRIRQEAARYGITIQQSSYETASL